MEIDFPSRKSADDDESSGFGLLVGDGFESLSLRWSRTFLVRLPDDVAIFSVEVIRLCIDYPLSRYGSACE